MSRTCTKCGCIIMSETDTNCLNCGAELPLVKIEENINNDFEKDSEKIEKAKKNLVGDMYFFVVSLFFIVLYALVNPNFVTDNLISFLIYLVIVAIAVLCIIKVKNNDKSAGYYSLFITLLFVPEAIIFSGFACWIVILCGYHTYKFFKAYK